MFTIILKRNASFRQVPDWPNEGYVVQHSDERLIENAIDQAKLAVLKFDRNRLPVRWAKDMTTDWYDYVMAFPGRQTPCHYEDQLERSK